MKTGKSEDSKKEVETKKEKIILPLDQQSKRLK